LGLAHGIPGVIALLGAACRVKAIRRQARPLLEGAIRWLLRQRLPRGSVSNFVAWADEGIEERGSRLAWRYGNAGAAIALFNAARCARNAVWERAALEIARDAAWRLPKDSRANSQASIKSRLSRAQTVSSFILRLCV
jgi:hypothetical protein